MRRRKIEKIPSAVATLSRRLEYLERRLDEQKADRKHREFDQREIGALRTSIDAMNLAQLFQRPESDPIALLEDLTDAIDGYRANADADGLERLLEVVARAKATVALADAYLTPGEAA